MTDASAPSPERSWAAPGDTRPSAPPIEAPVRRLGWTPPPKRGLLPLRPLPLGALFGAPFRLQRRTPRTTLAPALLVSLVTTVAALLVQWALVVGPQAALDASYYARYQAALATLSVLGGAGSFVPLVLALAGVAFLAGVVAVPSSRALLAERVSFAGLRRRFRGRTARLVAWSLLVLAAGAGVLVLATLPPLAAAVSAPFLGEAYAFLVALLEAIPVLLVGGILAARLGFTGPVVAIEGLRLRAAIARAWRLSRGSGWRLLGIQLLVWAAVGVAAFGLTAPLGLVLDYGGALVFPNGATSAESAAYDAVATVVRTTATVITGAFGLVLQSVCAALLYLDQRMRVEGLDHALARYVDERQRGVAVPDPFPAPAGGAA